MLKSVTGKLVIAWLGALMLVVNGCATIDDQKESRFLLIGEENLHADMKLMAGSLRTMAELDLKNYSSDIVQQRIVLTELDKIQSIAGSMGGDDVVTNYSVINQYMGSFLYDVQLAKQFAEKSPPNLVPANRLLNSCLSCHQSI